MGRIPKGNELLEQAKRALNKAKTVDELRQLQAVIFPLEMGISLEQTALLIGRSVRWTSQARTEFIQSGACTVNQKPGTGGRRRQNLTPEAEKDFLEPFLQKAKEGEILVVAEIHRALEQRLGRKIPLSSAYNLLHRHGWRKLAPDKRHVAADVEAQEAWKKNSNS
ncbi:winged helix-turn-helix domain-containing protein [Desulfovibrio inopinatus]|uniref:winged helix-turn-helix domain-containing protein n=1 Tax=Desulfovibrio inopinatus TaxID=102109 RepID=UPI0003F536F6|nr:winged helix-turn-helix domain-containing protein [Desulfovibrio inopinatus]